MASLDRRADPPSTTGLQQDLQAGVVLAVFAVLLSLSFGSLIFSGDLAPGARQGLLMALVTAVIGGGIVAWRTSYPGMIAIPQDRTAPILALMAAEIAAALPATATADEKTVAVLTAVSATTVFTGLVLYLVGQYRLGNFFRFIPYPVVGGFLAGSGWLLATGAFRVMMGTAVRRDEIDRLLQGTAPLKWIPGVVFGGTLFVLMRRFRQPWILPAMIAAGVATFYGATLLTGTSLDSIRELGLLPAPPGADGIHYHVASLAALGQLPAAAFLKLAGIAGSVLMTSLISILLNCSGLELVVHEEIDVNRELKAAGLANLACGMFGGMPGFQSLSLSRLAHELGSRKRRAGFIAAGLCLLALVAGPTPLAYLPKFIPGGLLLYLGLGFLVEWGYDAWFRMPRAECGVVLLILCVVGGVGYLEGVLVGVLAAVFLFIHNYSRVGVVTHAHTGADRQSNVERPLPHQRLLRARGGETQVLRLHGFIFFGTSTGVLDKIRREVSDPKRPRLRFFVLDLRQVSGIDSSATLSLGRARQLAEKKGFVLCLSHVPVAIRAQLTRTGFIGEAGDAHRFFSDLDHAQEWCEEQLLAIHGDEIRDPLDVRTQLEAIWTRPEYVPRLLPYLERQSFEVGTYLIRQGDVADALYFVETGEVTTRLELGNGHTHRLRRQGGGTVLGELGLFLGVPRTASVVVEKPCIAYRLSAESLRQMKADDPDVASEFHEFLVRYMAERIVNCNHTIRALAE